MDCKYWRSRVPTRDSASRRILKVGDHPALVAKWDYEQQIKVAVLNDEPTVDQIPLEAKNFKSGNKSINVVIRLGLESNN